MTDLPTFTTGLATVDQITCPECGGSGLMNYPDVGDGCPCMTCSDGLYEQGTGTIPAPGAPKALDWSEFGIWRDDELPTDWAHVASMDTSGGYDWATLHAFWSPTARRFFWASGSGCSCNSWGDDLRTEGDFENGNKDDLQRAIRQFAEDYSYSIPATAVLDAVSAVARFRPQPKEG